MAKKKHYLIIDTESTIEDHVADFGAVICNTKGEIITQCSVLVGEYFTTEKLFYDKNAGDLWSLAGLKKREDNYAMMLQQGTRLLSSVAGVNRWLEKAKATFDPELTAYNLAFDNRIMKNSGIDCAMFDRSFCLWQAAIGNYANSKAYREFCLSNHLFNNRTVKTGSMTMKTNAEVMASFIAGEMLPDEPHTAIEDVIGYELPILRKMLMRKDWRERIKPHSYRDYQLRDMADPRPAK